MPHSIHSISVKNHPCCSKDAELQANKGGEFSLYFACMDTKTITLRGAQQEVDQWIKTAGVKYFSELTNTAVLMEEVGELARIMAREYGEQSYRKGADKGNLADEMADVFWVLCCLANQTGVDLEAAFHQNLEKKQIRDATRHLENPKLKP